MHNFIILESLYPTGGVRQALEIMRKRFEIDYTILILINDDKPKGFHYYKQVLRAFLTKPKHVKLKLIKKHHLSSLGGRIFTTSKKTLIAIPNEKIKKIIHIHQHFEFWELLNSKHFQNLCEINGYLTPQQLVEQIKQNKLKMDDKKYLDRLKNISEVITVSRYLGQGLDCLNNDCNVTLSTVHPHIKYSKNHHFIREYDLLVFYRGSPWKGDAMSVALIHYFREIGWSICVVNSSKILHKKLRRFQNVTSIYKPSDKKLSQYYLKSKIVVTPSLSEGFGSIPQEGLAFGCKVVTSKTGVWDQENKSLLVCQTHNLVEYVEKIKQFGVE